jgi:hypothetical protein
MNQLIKTTANKLKCAFSLENLFKPTQLVNLRVIFGGIILLILAGYAKLLGGVMNPDVVQKLKLVTLPYDVLDFYKMESSSFWMAFTFQTLIVISIIAMLLYFNRFLASISLDKPFENPKSKREIIRVAKLAMLVTFLDLLLRVVLCNAMLPDGSAFFDIGLYNVEYYFISNVLLTFAVIYTRGVDLKNEIDLVV